jgi:hypothetical protein
MRQPGSAEKGLTVAGEKSAPARVNPGAPKLPRFEDSTNPVLGNLAFDYGAVHLMVYDGQDWQSLGRAAVPTPSLNREVRNQQRLRWRCCLASCRSLFTSRNTRTSS